MKYEVIEYSLPIPSFAGQTYVFLSGHVVVTYQVDGDLTWRLVGYTS